MAIDMVKIRAKIELGGLVIETPYILSFTVTKTRGIISTFSASLKIYNADINGNLVSESIKISAGENIPHLIFTGVVKKATISPCWDDPSYVLLNISGEDMLSYLKGKKYTRRCRGSKSSWANIVGVTRSGLKSGKFKPVNGEVFSINSAELDKDAIVVRVDISGNGKIVAAPGVSGGGDDIAIQIEVMPK